MGDGLFNNSLATTTLAAIDRVVHHSVILDMMSGESYRAQEATHQHVQQEQGAS